MSHPTPDDVASGVVKWRRAWQLGLALSLPTAGLLALRLWLTAATESERRDWLPEIDRELKRRGFAA